MTERRRAMWAVVVAAALVGTTGTAQALGPQTATPLGVGAVRAIGGAAALWLFARGASWSTLRRFPMLVGAGSFGVALYQPAFFVGVDRLGVALGTVLAIGSGPAFAGLLAWGLGRRPRRQWVIGTTVAVVGGSAMVWARASIGSGTDSSIDLLGVAGALLAGFGYALYATTAQLLADRGVDATEALAWQFSFGSIVLIPLLFTQPMGWLATPRGLVMAIHLGLVTIAVAYALIGFAIDRIDAPMVTTLFQIEPVTAGVLAVVVLHETLPAVAWVGAVTVIVGLLIATNSAPERSHAEV